MAAQRDVPREGGHTVTVYRNPHDQGTKLVHTYLGNELHA